MMKLSRNKNLLLDRRTKIIATVGPASHNEGILRAMISAGVNIFRLNFSHGTHTDHEKTVNTIRKVEKEFDTSTTILQDLQGPKLRIGYNPDLVESLEIGDVITFLDHPGEGNEIWIDLRGILDSIEPGDLILIDDGRIKLNTIEVGHRSLTTTVIEGGQLRPKLGVHLPDSQLTLPSMTKKDVKDLKFGLGIGVDAVALSFVTSAQNIIDLKALINELEPSREIVVVAKIERQSALSNLSQILKVSDGVMVARGDLGVEMSPEEIPLVQKKIIAEANLYSRYVITATQMLESMINRSTPTRAEASDVANAILDGTDAVMLSGETAIGKYPIKSIQMMDAVIREAEKGLSQWGHWEGENRSIDLGIETDPNSHDDAVSIARGAKELAHDRHVSAIALFTQSGRTAKLIAKTRPRVPILAFTSDENTFHQLPLYWGVIPYQVPYTSTMEEMLKIIDITLKRITDIQPGQQVVFVTGFPVGRMRPPNLALLHTIGESIK